MGDASIQDERPLDALFDGTNAAVYFGDHAAGDGAVLLQGGHAVDGQQGDEGAAAGRGRR